MSASDTVLQIVPHMPGTFDGVGDYALNLAQALLAQHGITTTFLVAGPASAASREGFAIIRGLSPTAVADLAQKHRHVILHFVNYGYQPRGVPLRLRRFAQQLRREIRGKWVTTFHELYASGPPWESAFWVRPLQVRIARDLIDLSDVCIVSNRPIEKEIHAYDPDQPVHLLPVMSNFGEPKLIPFETRSPRRWAICGGTALIARSLVLLEKLLPRIPDSFTPQHLDVVGGRFDESITSSLARLKQKDSLAVHHYPEVTVELASEVLRRSSFGWIDYFGAGTVWPGMVLKSTAFAALCAHGVIPILSHREQSFGVDDDVLPGPYCLTRDAVAFPAATEDIAQIGRRFYDWYHAHADSARAADVYATALQ